MKAQHEARQGGARSILTTNNGLLAVLQHDLLVPSPCSLCGHVIYDETPSLRKYPPSHHRTEAVQDLSPLTLTVTRAPLTLVQPLGVFSSHTRQLAILDYDSVTIREGLPMVWASEMIYSVWPAPQTGTSTA